MINPEDLILVSVDDHICEPREMFDAHVPAKYRDQAPRVVEDDDGVEQWWYGDRRGRNIGLNAAAGKSREYFNLDAFLARSEHVQKRHSGWTRHTFPDGGSPTTIFRDHLLCSFISEDVGIELIDRFNIDNVCWESDSPHSDTDWPNAPEVVADVMAPLSAEQVAKITHENAMRRYHFDPFATRAKEQCTVAALRAESPDVDTVTRVGRLATERDAEIFKYALRGIKVPASATEHD